MDNGDWLISIVTNKTGHFRARLDLYHPWRIANVERDETLEKELREKVHAPAVPWGLVWPEDDLVFGLDRCCSEHTSNEPPYDDILAELQLVGLNTDQAAELLDAIEDWQGDLDEFWIILDGALGGDGQAVDPWSVLQALGECGFVDGADHAVG